MQLALDINIDENSTLNNFCWQGNELIETQIKSSLEANEGGYFYLWGAEGSGKSHLLQAISESTTKSSVYLPLKQVKDYGVDVLQGIDACDVIALDDIDVICGNKEFEIGLFHLYNKVKDSGDKLLFIAGHCAPAALDITLPDLKSRLAWGFIAKLNELDEAHKISTLKQHAQEIGLSLESQAAEFLLKRCSRNMQDLHVILKKLDKASLQAQRKLTIPFIKKTLML